jgi:hypothetical protein
VVAKIEKVENPWDSLTVAPKTTVSDERCGATVAVPTARLALLISL